MPRTLPVRTSDLLRVVECQLIVDILVNEFGLTMNNFVLKTIPVNQFGEEVTTLASQLSTSKSVQDVCDSISKRLNSNSCLENHLNLFHVVGSVGSGRTTFCKAVLKKLIQNHSVKESGIVYIKIKKNDNIDCVWKCGMQLARRKNMGIVTSVLASQSCSQQEKEEAMVRIFNSFKVVSFDSLSPSQTNNQLYSLLMSILHKLTNNVIHIISSKETLPPNHGTIVQVHGLNRAAISGDLNWEKTVQYLDANYQSINKTTYLNPLAVQLLLNASQIFGICQQEEIESLTDVLNIIWPHLSDHERLVLFQLSELRQELPLENAEALSRIIQIGLIDYKPLSGNLFGQVILSDSVQDFVLAKAETSQMRNKTDPNFDVFDCWMKLLCEELIGLIDEARNNVWPLVPEKWYVYMKEQLIFVAWA